MKKMILMGVAAFLLIGVSVGASLFFTGAFSEKEPVAGAAEPVEEDTLPEDILYHNIQPEFVVNFQDKTRMQFLMIELAVVTRDEEVLTVMSDHDPEIRNTLLLLLSEQNSDVLKTVEGKQTLQTSAIERINEVVGKYHRDDRIMNVLITRLVMQ